MTNPVAEFLPVLTAEGEKMLDTALSAPFSQVSTDGPRWLSAADREAIVRDEGRSHLVVQVDDQVVGAITWTRGGTPGFFRLTVTSCHDEAWTPELMTVSVARAMRYLLRGFEVRRVELLVGTYNEIALSYLTLGGHFTAEGVLRDRFFLDGRYWPGIICRADLMSFREPADEPNSDQVLLMALLRKKTLDDLTAAWEAAGAGDGG